MPKNNKKKQTKDTKDPQKLKELGNKAFINKNYEEAIEMFSKAIEEDPTDPVFFTNRAAVYLTIDKLDESVKDCDKAIEINKNFVKAYFRKAQALREKLDDLGAIEVLKAAIELDPENSDLSKLLDQTRQEYEEDNSIPIDHPERQRFETLLKWLEQGGSHFEKLKIRYYTADYRGVHAARDIKKGEIILYVPKHQIITLEMAMTSPVGKKMYEKGLRQRFIGIKNKQNIQKGLESLKISLRLISPKHSFLSTYIMQEKRKPESQWQIYIDILPKNFSNFPIFFTEEERIWLKGSPFLDQILEKIEDIKADYDLICKEVPEFKLSYFIKF